MPRKSKKEAEAKEEAKEEKAEKETEKPKKEEAKEKESEKKDELLVPLEEYVKSGIHIGTRVITAQMRKYVFRRRTDGLAIFNTNVIDQKIRNAAAFIANYAPEEIIVSGKREASWKALNSFSKATGIKVFTKKYPAGIITNTGLPGFFEPKLMAIVDPWLDKNSISDALHVNIPIIALCDTNNLFSSSDLIIPCNNKSNKSIGLIFWILAGEYNKIRKIKNEIPNLTDFVGEVKEEIKEEVREAPVIDI